MCDKRQSSALSALIRYRRMSVENTRGRDVTGKQ